MQQHAQTVHRAVAPRARSCKQRCLAGNVDNVADIGRGRQRGERETEWRIADHALARCIDHERDAVQRRVAFLPSQRLDRAAERLAERKCALVGAVDQTDLGGAFMHQRVNHGPRGSARANHRDRARIGAPAGKGLAQIVENPVPVVVGAGQRSVWLHRDAGDGADAPCPRIRMIDDLKRALLVGDGEIAARKAKRGQGAQGALQPLGLDGEGHIGAGKAGACKPVIVQLGRARVHHGPAHDAGQHETIRVTHGKTRAVEETARFLPARATGGKGAQ